jgi:hypothetical protein
MFAQATSHRVFTAVVMSLLLLGTSGCKTVFTQGIRESGVTVPQLKQLRYYLSKEVTLARDVTRSQTRVAGTHALTIRNGRSIDYVVFPAGTYGAVVGAGANWVDVKFESGPARLRFVATNANVELEDVIEFGSGHSIVIGDPTDAYRLAAVGWEFGPMEMPWGMTETGWHAIVEYGGDEYVAIEASFSACLQIDSNSVETERKTKRFVTGLDVTEVQAEEREQANESSRRRRGQPATSRPARRPQQPPGSSED